MAYSPEAIRNEDRPEFVLIYRPVSKNAESSNAPLMALNTPSLHSAE